LSCINNIKDLVYIDYSITTNIVRQITLFFLLIDKLNFRLVRISQYLLQLLLNIRYCTRRLYTISNALSRLLALKNKYNKNKLLILNKIDNFAIDVQAITKLIQQTSKKKLNLVN